MNRETYIQLREQNSGEILYEYYKENFDKNKHNNFLEYSEFIQAMQIWGEIRDAFSVSTAYYDSKFNILKVFLEEKTLFI